MTSTTENGAGATPRQAAEEEAVREGMKVLRSSPHCCVDEIRRMRMAEEGNNQILEQKLDRGATDQESKGRKRLII